MRELAIAAGVSDGVIRGLVKAGAIEAVEVSVDDPFPLPDPDHSPPELELAQGAAAHVFVEAVRGAEFAPFLLDGVTGSGKTEVYFEAVAEALRLGRQTLVLLPEIALTEPFLKRFAARFGHEPVAWHSGLRQSQRRRAWRAIASGQAVYSGAAAQGGYAPTLQRMAQACPAGQAPFLSADLTVAPPQPEEARRLLAEAGYPQGFRLTLHGPNDRYQNDARIVQAVAQMWTRAGVETLERARAAERGS